MRVLKHVGCHFRNAAEFTRQRPFSTRAIAQDAAEHARLRSRTGDFIHFSDAIDGKQTHTERVSGRNIALFLDRIPERNTIRGCTSGKRHFDFDNGSRIKARAHRREQPQNSGIGIGLHGVINAGIGQSPRKGLIIIANDIEIDNNARTILTSGA